MVARGCPSTLGRGGGWQSLLEDTIAFAFLAGLVFGTQYWITRSLWPSLISHATINGIIQIDWRCLSGQWNPMADDIPVVLPGLLAIGLFVVCIIALLAILRQMATEAKRPPR